MFCQLCINNSQDEEFPHSDRRVPQQTDKYECFVFAKKRCMHLAQSHIALEVTLNIEFYPQDKSTTCTTRSWQQYSSRETKQSPDTALHQNLFKYLTAQDTSGTPTLIKNNRILARPGNQCYLQPRSKIKVNRVVSVPCIE